MRGLKVARIDCRMPTSKNGLTMSKMNLLNCMKSLLRGIVKKNIIYTLFFIRLFVLPHYCSAMVDLSLLHSRKKRNQSKEEYKEEISKADSKVYICATMWHENRIEMKQILISIFRYFETRSSIWKYFGSLRQWYKEYKYVILVSICIFSIIKNEQQD